MVFYRTALVSTGWTTVYSGELSREKTFANFAVFWLCGNVFSAKFGAWHSLARHKQAIREHLLRKNCIFHKSAKVFSLESFPLYGISHLVSTNGLRNPCISLQKQVGSFNHRGVTLVADKLETERFTLVWKTNWIRQPKKQLPSFSYITTVQWQPSEHLWKSHYKCTSKLQ